MKIFPDQIIQTDKCMAYRVLASKSKLLFKNQPIFCQKRVKSRAHTFFIQFAKN